MLHVGAWVDRVLAPPSAGGDGGLAGAGRTTGGRDCDGRGVGRPDVVAGQQWPVRMEAFGGRCAGWPSAESVYAARWLARKW
jgi:hypothetical protein